MDHYQTMGVARDATEEQIRKAYRKLAMKYHPDRNPGDADADAKFKEIQSAYDVLSDSDKKRLYDMQTASPRRASPPPKAQPKPPPKKEPPPPKPQPEEIKCTYFGDAWAGRSIMIQLKLTPQQMKIGGVHYVKIKKRDLCGKCVGDGRAIQLCPGCRGRKPDVGWCPRCNGDGGIEAVCNICNGEGVKEWIEKEVKIHISPNIQPGHTINILGEGEAAPRRPPGNLRVVIVQ